MTNADVRSIMIVAVGVAVAVLVVSLMLAWVVGGWWVWTHDEDDLGHQTGISAWWEWAEGAGG